MARTHRFEEFAKTIEDEPSKDHREQWEKLRNSFWSKLPRFDSNVSSRNETRDFVLTEALAFAKKNVEALWVCRHPEQA
jgi:hypothetical protein